MVWPLGTYLFHFYKLKMHCTVSRAHTNTLSHLTFIKLFHMIVSIFKWFMAWACCNGTISVFCGHFFSSPFLFSILLLFAQCSFILRMRDTHTTSARSSPRAWKHVWFDHHQRFCSLLFCTHTPDEQFRAPLKSSIKRCDLRVRAHSLSTLESIYGWMAWYVYMDLGTF